MLSPSHWQRELGTLVLALALASLFAWAVYAHWAEPETEPVRGRLCFYSPVMIFPWVPGLCVLVFLAWKART
jgi:hypothetical protein